MFFYVYVYGEAYKVTHSVVTLYAEDAVDRHKADAFLSIAELAYVFLPLESVTLYKCYY